MRLNLDTFYSKIDNQESTVSLIKAGLPTEALEANLSEILISINNCNFTYNYDFKGSNIVYSILLFSFNFPNIPLNLILNNSIFINIMSKF